jgi:hypothetical protein
MRELTNDDKDKDDKERQDLRLRYSVNLMVVVRGVERGGGRTDSIDDTDDWILQRSEKPIATNDEEESGRQPQHTEFLFIKISFR